MNAICDMLTLGDKPEGRQVIRRIDAINAVGLFLRAGPSPDFEPLTLLCAENGRGKSTLATILKSASLDDSASILSKQTIDASDSQLVRIVTADPSAVVFGNGAWTSQLSRVDVFDSRFIEDNVYSGNEIGPAQRAQLLEFCIGEEAVRLQHEFNELTESQSQTSGQIRFLKAKLEGLTKGVLTVERYIIEQPDPGLRGQLEQARRDLAAAEQATQLRTQPGLPLIGPLPDLTNLVALLRAEVPGVASAGQRVRQHADALHDPEALAWLEKGHQLSSTGECPFCDQDLGHSPIAAMYARYFSEEFSTLGTQVGTAARVFADAFGHIGEQSLDLGIQRAEAARLAWSPFVETDEIAVTGEILLASVRQAHESITPLLEQKRDNLGAAIDDAGIISTLSERVSEAWEAVNNAIRVANTTIEAFRARIEFASTEQLRVAVVRLQVRIDRFDESSMALVQEYVTAVEEKERIEQDRATMRTTLDAAINQSMANYMEGTNRILRSFSSNISIERMSHNYSGGRPRMDYALAIRNHEVGSGRYTFGNTFSDGDRRSLALAFFLARAQMDDEIALKTLFVDDPMSSLDGSRRSNTISLLIGIADAAEQLIVASHDAYFLQEFKDRWGRRRQRPNPAVIQIRAVGAGYSDFEECDVDQLCRSRHVQRLVALETYIAEGAASDEVLGLAQSLRPLLEGYLHRRFPSAIPRGTMLGAALNEIRDAPTDSPLAHLQSSLLSISDLAGYANQFHHDTNPNAQDAVVDEGELRGQATMLIELLYAGSLQ